MGLRAPQGHTHLERGKLESSGCSVVRLGRSQNVVTQNTRAWDHRKKEPSPDLQSERCPRARHLRDDCPDILPDSEEKGYWYLKAAMKEQNRMEVLPSD